MIKLHTDGQESTCRRVDEQNLDLRFSTNEQECVCTADHVKKATIGWDHDELCFHEYVSSSTRSTGRKSTLETDGTAGAASMSGREFHPVFFRCLRRQFLRDQDLRLSDLRFWYTALTVGFRSRPPMWLPGRVPPH